MSKKQKRKQKSIPIKEWDKLKETYKFHKVGIIKEVEFGCSVGTRLGAFGHMMDGPFGLQLVIVEESFGFPLHWTVTTEECHQFFREMGINKGKELIGKPVSCLSNSEAINHVDKVVPHIGLLKGLKNE